MTSVKWVSVGALYKHQWEHTERVSIGMEHTEKEFEKSLIYLLLIYFQIPVHKANIIKIFMLFMLQCYCIGWNSTCRQTITHAQLMENMFKTQLNVIQWILL